MLILLNTFRLPRPEYAKLTRARMKEAARKLQHIKWYVRVLSYIPTIRLVGLSGSIAVGVAKKTDDIDLFIITKAHWLWTTRFLTIVIALLCGLKRSRGAKRAKDKVCLNLFFDERDVCLPKKKQTIYGAHEVLQMVPLITIDNTYERFLKANRWVRTYFPNVVIPRTPARTIESTSGVGDVVESLLKRFQLWIMHTHRTTEVITDTQLWFLPRDIESSLKRHIKKL